MLYGVSPALDHLCFSAKGFNFFLRTCAEGIYLYGELLSQFAIPKDFNAILWILNDSLFQQSFHCNHCIIFKRFQSAYIDSHNVFGIAVCESTLRNPSI